jgi:hypothetical protein
MITFDERDAELLKLRIEAREKIDGPRIGDFVIFDNGVIGRFSHDWGDKIQWSSCPNGDHWGFHLFSDGHASFSGSLNPSIMKDQLECGRSEDDRNGKFWFFHHDFAGAGRGVYCDVPCRVYGFRGEIPYSARQP